MILSMTGFGEAAQQMDGIHYTVELRSVNNRYFKTAIRLPDEFMCMEGELEALLRKKLNRGSVTLTVKVHDPHTAARPRIDDTALAGYLDQLESVRQKMSSIDANTHVDLTALLNLPGVLQPLQAGPATLDKIRPLITGLADQACSRLASMRSTEGRLLAEDLAGQCGVIDRLLTDVAKRAPEVVEAYHQRLRARIDELLARAQLQVQEKDLIREVAVFAEKADISEEVSRMGSHMEQFEQIVSTANGQPAGRTLDFVAQELLREANTISSKSNDAQISRAIVEIKGSIDRIKEQVQNVA